MREILKFMKEKSKIIEVIVIIMFLVLLVIINIKGIKSHIQNLMSKLGNQVIIETFTGQLGLKTVQDSVKEITLSQAASFCKSYVGNSVKLEAGCNQLTKTNCATTKCCGYTNEKCVAGGIHGPTYKTDKEGNFIGNDSYYYLGNCSGGECPT